MTDRVFPSSKPTPNGTNGTAAPTTTNGRAANPSFLANKDQLYNASRPVYRPTPYHNHRRRRRSFCCSCCLWTTLVIFVLLVLVAITGAVLYVLYNPHRPSFSLSSLRASQFNLASSSQLTSKFNLTITARNPNRKITFYYNPITVLITSNGVNVGAGSIPAFTHGTKNTTTLKATVTSTGQSVDGTKLNLKKKSLPLKIQLDTKVKVKIGGMRTKKIRIRVNCRGIKATLPAGKTATEATTADAKCKVDIRIKIWKWTV